MKWSPVCMSSRSSKAKGYHHAERQIQMQNEIQTNYSEKKNKYVTKSNQNPYDYRYYFILLFLFKWLWKLNLLFFSNCCKTIRAPKKSNTTTICVTLTSWTCIPASLLSKRQILCQRNYSCKSAVFWKKILIFNE